MTAIILVVHLLIAIALIGVVLLQRSEGGALGIGSGGAGSLFSSRGAANVLTRTTAVLAVAFFITSIALTMIARKQHAPSSVFDEVKPAESGQQPATPVLPQLPPANQGPQVPVGQ
jgi:preprotein translocase subunit SecG